MREKNAMFEGRVTMISWLERSSAIICTFPRIMPRSASLTSASLTAAVCVAEASCCVALLRVTPGSVREIETPRCIPPLIEFPTRGAAVDFLLFSSSSRDAWTNSSNAFFTSAALAFLMA